MASVLVGLGGRASWALPVVRSDVAALVTKFIVRHPTLGIVELAGVRVCASRCGSSPVCLAEFWAIGVPFRYCWLCGVAFSGIFLTLV